MTNKRVIPRNRVVIWLHITAIVVVICIAYLKIFHAPFAANDDREYVVNNPDIRAVTWDNIVLWFSTYYVGNYHPVTMVSYAIDRAIGGGGPFVYHISNLLLHLLNAVVLYLFIRRLCGRKDVAFFATLLFALHPAQTEVVSWVAERKALLSGLFSLLALYVYVGHVRRPSIGRLVLTTALCLLALLSKAIAVTLPLSLFAVDVWMRRDMTSVKVWVEKIPMLLCSVVLGTVAIRALAYGHFLETHPEFGIWERIVFAANAYWLYIAHMLSPVSTSSIYPYPESIGALQYLYLACTAALLLLGIYAWRRKRYMISGGVIFCTTQIIPVLQLVQASEHIMADRYMYIACIGVYFPFCYYSLTLAPKWRPTIVVTGAALAFWSLIATYVRNDIWLSELNFFNAILEKYPESPSAQYSVGALYLSEGKYDEAEQHMDRALQLAPGNHVAWYNKGVLELRKGRVNQALYDLNRCLAIEPYEDAFFSRAVIYMGIGKYRYAQVDADTVLRHHVDNARAWYISAYSRYKQGDINGAISGYSNAILYDNAEPLFFAGRADAYTQAGRFHEAIADLDVVIGSRGNDGETYYKRALAKMKVGENGQDDINRAIAFGYKMPADVSAH